MDAVLRLLSAGWLGTFIGIVGITIALRSRVRRTLAYQHRSVQLIGGKAALPPAVEVRYNDKPVSRLTRSSVAIWNSGNETIEGSAVVVADPLRIATETGSEILSVEVENVTREVIAFRACIEPRNSNVITLSFDFLDPNDGAVVTCLHTGQSWALTGTIKGLQGQLRNCDKFERVDKRKWLGLPLPFHIGWLQATPLALLGILCVYVGLMPTRGYGFGIKPSLWPMYVFGAFFLAGAFNFWSSVYKTPPQSLTRASLPPKPS